MMDQYVCPCGYEYDPAVGGPDNGVAPGTPWEDVPSDWVCPGCGLGKSEFEKAYYLRKMTASEIRGRHLSLFF